MPKFTTPVLPRVSEEVEIAAQNFERLVRARAKSKEEYHRVWQEIFHPEAQKSDPTPPKT